MARVNGLVNDLKNGGFNTILMIDCGIFCFLAFI
jgi:hypothetical protein